MFWPIFWSVFCGIITVILLFVARDSEWSDPIGNLIISILFGGLYGVMVYYWIDFLGVSFGSIIGLIVVWIFCMGFGISVD